MLDEFVKRHGRLPVRGEDDAEYWKIRREVFLKMIGEQDKQE